MKKYPGKGFEEKDWYLYIIWKSIDKGSETNGQN